MRRAKGRRVSFAAAWAVDRCTGSNPSDRSQSAIAAASVTLGNETMTLGRADTREEVQPVCHAMATIFPDISRHLVGTRAIDPRNCNLKERTVISSHHCRRLSGRASALRRATN